MIELKSTACPRRGKTDYAPAPCSLCGTLHAPTEDAGYFRHPDEGDVPVYPDPVPGTGPFVRYTNLANECGRIFRGAFLPDGRRVAVSEIPGAYVKNGKWSYTPLDIVAPTEAILVCVSRSTHRHANRVVHLRRRDRRVDIGKLADLQRLPDPAEVSSGLGLDQELTPEVLRHICLFGADHADRARWAELEALPEIQETY